MAFETFLIKPFFSATDPMMMFNCFMHRQYLVSIGIGVCFKSVSHNYDTKQKKKKILENNLKKFV